MFLLIITLLLVIAGVVILYVVKSDQNKKKIQELDAALSNQTQQTEHFKKIWQKYKPIADIEAAVEAQRRIAQEIIAEATKKSRDVEFAANKYSIEQQKYADDLINDAKAEKQKLLSSVENEAQQAINDAAAARKEKAAWDAALRAIKNVVKGYGNQYLVPNRSVLDELAEGWGHKEAGQKLKELRDAAKDMVNNNQAADCDYSEAVRRETAIKFVIDAFNGRVDAILSNVKHDNYGKLAAQIRDIYAVVNHNGEAFRNARITPNYLLTRLEELRWAVAVFELKEQEKEEQRQIREQMREEEKVRRDCEKALKEAEKQEKELQRRMREAEQQLKLASVEADRERLLAEIAGLQVSLTEAEAQGQRAISMAQQTKCGHVYVISNIGSFGEDVFKIGLTRRLEPLDRIKELGDASVPFSFDVHALLYSENAPDLETKLHNYFVDQQVNKANPRKEFFRLTLHEIKALVEGMEDVADVEWTMTAEAREYRETLAIDAAGGHGKLLTKVEAEAEMVEAE